MSCLHAVSSKQANCNNLQKSLENDGSRQHTFVVIVVAMQLVRAVVTFHVSR